MDCVVSALSESLSKGESAVLCCIVASAGSSPRKSGAKMAVFADGHTAGTVGGGQVEYMASRHALSLLPDAPGEIRDFDLQGNRPKSIGMVCGGAVTLLFRVLHPEDLPTVRRWEEAISDEGRAWLLMGTGAQPGEGFAVLTEETCLASGRALPPLQPAFDGGLYTEPVAHPDRVFLFGGGHVGKALLTILASTGFSVTLLDHREELARPELFPLAHRVILSDYSHIAGDITIKDGDYIVVMTPGHMADFKILAQILSSDATYIGCLGSKRKVAAMRAALLEQGFSEERIDSIHSPIGLPILAETPEEIAVSIAAEMIEHRAKRRAKEDAL